MPHALVTGATGLVGSHILERLYSDGWTLRALVRDQQRAAWLEQWGVELATGDVLDASGFHRAATGCDTIFHCAAAILPKAGGWETYRSTNIDGTRNAIDAAAESGARLLQLSSVAVYGSSARYRDSPTSEDIDLAPLPEDAYYARSKRESEALVLGAHARGKIWATAVRPDVIYGRRDRQFVPRAAALFSKGFVPLINGGLSTLAIVHAANVADGAIRAAATDIAGGRVYNLANDFDVNVATFVRFASQGLDKRILAVRVPLGVARLGFRAVSLMLRVLGEKDVASQAGGAISFLSRDNPFSSERARRELGWSPPVRPEVGIPDAFRWWRENHRS